MARRKPRILLAVLALVLVAAVFAWLAFWKEPLVVVTVTVSPEQGRPDTVFASAMLLSDANANSPGLRKHLKLDQWAGKLVRLDIEAGLVAARAVPLQRGRVACSIALSDPSSTSERELSFPTWENEGPPELHLGALGCPVHSTDDGSAVYSSDGRLWCTLRVPPGASLDIAFTPLAGSGSPSEPDPKPRPVPPRLTLAPVSDPGSLPNVFIYLVDALRADHIGAYGYSRGTTPTIDGFGDSATVYENAQTAATWTRPSVASLMTGLPAFVHGAMRRTTDRLQEWPILLPEVLRAAGYQTAGIVTNTAVNEKCGFNQGYDCFIYRYKYPTDWVNGQVERFLQKADPDRPVFMYLHIMEAHSPYTPGDEARALFDRGIEGSCDGTTESIGAAGRVRPNVQPEDIEHLIDLYDAEIYEADRGFGHFLDIVRASGRFDNALIVFLADHGEAFNEHRTLEHGNTLNREEMHVPLIVRYPGGRYAGQHVRARVSLRDLFPTVLGVTGLEGDPGYPLDGLDLRPDVANGAASQIRPIFSEVSKHANNHLDLIGVIDEEGYKRVLDMSVPRGIRATTESVGLWDTSVDEREQADLRRTRPVRASHCEQLIANWLTQQRELRESIVPDETVPMEMTEDLERELRGLGYVD